MRFHKYHALGNDYIVMDPADFPGLPASGGAKGDQCWPAPTTEQIRVICHRNFGAGSDGILWGPLPTTRAQFGLRIFNPDGSEAEKSGNGLRIFSRYLYDQHKVGTAPFTVDTPGGVVNVVIQPGGQLLTIDMGHVSFDSAKIPVTGPVREVIMEKITVLDREFDYCAATIGNPHCVIPLSAVSPLDAQKYGQYLEIHPNFPNKTNVQFLYVMDRANIRIEIWERGAGYTLASGSSSCASAAVAHRLGWVDRSVTVHMPGGQIGIEIGDNFSIRMTGPVTRVADGTLHPELFTTKV